MRVSPVAVDADDFGVGKGRVDAEDGSNMLGGSEGGQQRRVVVQPKPLAEPVDGDSHAV